jgi:endoglucanase
MPIPEVLRALLSTPSPSGNEQAAATVWREAAGRFAEVSSDTMGSSFARVPGTQDGRRLILVGHVDEIGLMVSHIDEQGFLRFIGVGGWDPMILLGQRVEVLGRSGTVPGVVGKKPIHLLSDEERKQVPKLKQLHIDIGATDAEDARSMVAEGDVAVIAAEPVELPHDRFVSRSMDNRIGAYVVYEAARLVAEAGGAPGDVIAVAAVQEEVGLKGSQTSAFALEPDVAVAVDVTHATDPPGIELGELASHGLGSGAVITRATSLHPRVTRLLIDAAETQGIAHSFEAASRRTGTDADAIALTRAGVPTGLVSVPLRYMHSPVELAQVDDVHAAARTIAAFAQGLAADESFAR